jgi:hypothetical protein
MTSRKNPQPSVPRGRYFTVAAGENGLTGQSVVIIASFLRLSTEKIDSFLYALRMKFAVPVSHENWAGRVGFRQACFAEAFGAKRFCEAR